MMHIFISKIILILQWADLDLMCVIVIFLVYIKYNCATLLLIVLVWLYFPLQMGSEIASTDRYLMASIVIGHRRDLQMMHYYVLTNYLAPQG